MSGADAIREYAFKNYIEPARKKGEKTVTIRAGDVHDSMKLKSRLPAVCSALGTNKFLEDYGLKLSKREGPTCAANVYFTFEV